MKNENHLNVTNDSDYEAKPTVRKGHRRSNSDYQIPYQS